MAHHVEPVSIEQVFHLQPICDVNFDERIIRVEAALNRNIIKQAVHIDSAGNQHQLLRDVKQPNVVLQKSL
jgi:hypothetical protein